MTKEEIVNKLENGGKIFPYMERFEAEEVVNFVLDNYYEESENSDVNEYADFDSELNLRTDVELSSEYVMLSEVFHSVFAKHQADKIMGILRPFISSCLDMQDVILQNNLKNASPIMIINAEYGDLHESLNSQEVK